jgi:stearoyl-CoA desaturase (delta-9 desaturase)
MRKLRAVQMAFRRRVATTVEYTSFEVTPAPLVSVSPKALTRLESITRLDRPLALASIVVPPLGLVIALVLLSQGYGGWLECTLAVGMYVVTMTGIVVGYHRHLAHRAFNTTPCIRAVLAVLGSMASQGPVIWWAATHRRHHQTSDQPGDPHSPHLHGAGMMTGLQGLLHAHMGWLFAPQSVRPLGWTRYAPDLYRDAAVFKVHMSYFSWLLVGLAIPAIIDGALTWTWTGVWLGFLWGGLVRLFFSSHFSWAINSICHRHGSRPFDTYEHSKNNFWLAIPILGEGWHNNHHAFPSSATTGLRWWQIDPGGWIIRGLEICGLAWDIKIPTSRMIEAKARARVTPRQ